MPSNKNSTSIGKLRHNKQKCSGELHKNINMFQQLMLIKFSVFRGAFLFVLWFVWQQIERIKKKKKVEMGVERKTKVQRRFSRFPDFPASSTFPLSGCVERFAVLWRTDGNTCCCPPPTRCRLYSPVHVCVVYRSAVELSIYCRFTFASSVFSCYSCFIFHIVIRLNILMRF